jgi:hypothetical protein
VPATNRPMTASSRDCFDCGMQTARTRVMRASWTLANTWAYRVRETGGSGRLMTDGANGSRVNSDADGAKPRPPSRRHGPAVAPRMGAPRSTVSEGP